MAPLDRIKARTVVTEGGCFEWTGGKIKAGHGYLHINKKAFYVHRLAWELLVGPVALDHELHHRCENPACWNIEHVEPLTRSEHKKRHMTPRCHRGHLYAEGGYVYRNGKQRCAFCTRSSNLAYHQRCRDRLKDPKPVSGA